MIFTTEEFLKVDIVDIERRLSCQAMSSTRSHSQLCTATPISFLSSVFTFHFGLCLLQSPHLF